MSDTMSASGAQAPEPMLGLSEQASATPPLEFTEQQSQCDLAWTVVTIRPTDISGELRLEASDSDVLYFSGSSALNVGPLHPPAKFASHGQPEREFVYASLCDDLLTLTYILYPLGDAQEPPVTGVWLGTSTGGQLYRPVKA